MFHAFLDLQRLYVLRTARQALLFLKKKKQKDFLTLGLGRWPRNAHGLGSKKFFGSRVLMIERLSREI
jgi:hypothetical protein